MRICNCTFTINKTKKKRNIQLGKFKSFNKYVYVVTIE